MKEIKMPVSRIPPLLFSTLALFFAPVRATAQPNEIFPLSVDDLNAGYLQWMDHHSELFSRGSRNTILTPSFDLYSPGGVSIYHGDDATKNAAFIRALPGKIAGQKAGSPRPTLQEAMEMIPQFKGRQYARPAGNQYTLFAVTFSDWDLCKPQNDAVAELRKRSHDIGVRIIEVRLRQ